MVLGCNGGWTVQVGEQPRERGLKNEIQNYSNLYIYMVIVALQKSTFLHDMMWVGIWVGWLKCESQSILHNTKIDVNALIF